MLGLSQLSSSNARCSPIDVSLFTHFDKQQCFQHYLQEVVITRYTIALHRVLDHLNVWCRHMFTKHCFDWHRGKNVSSLSCAKFKKIKIINQYIIQLISVSYGWAIPPVIFSYFIFYQFKRIESFFKCRQYV